MSVSKNKLFWLLQFLGWGSIALINTWGKFANGANLNPVYMVSEGLLFFIGGLASTTVFRHHIVKDVDFDNIHKTKVLKIIRHYFGAVSIFSMTMVIALGVHVIANRPPYTYYKLTSLNVFSTVLNIALFLFFWFVLYMAIKTIKHLRKAKIESLELKTELKEAQLNTLISQINPHFMFNSLNNIRGLMLEDVNKARDMITRLSDMLRYSLTKDNSDTIAISEELEMVENYIALAKIQLEDRLEFQSNVSDDLLNATIPPMIVQMLIENAVKHGIANQSDGGKVSLDINKKQNELTIRVTNTGKLLSKSNSTKLGLVNIKKRLALIYKNSASFDLSEVDNTVIATIKSPYE